MHRKSKSQAEVYSIRSSQLNHNLQILSQRAKAREKVGWLTQVGASVQGYGWNEVKVRADRG